MIHKRDEMIDNRMKYTAEEIALYNSRAYNDFVNGMRLIRGSDKWVPPNIEEILNGKRSS